MLTLNANTNPVTDTETMVLLLFIVTPPKPGLIICGIKPKQ